MVEELVTKLTANFLKILAHPVRLKILRMLESRERSVCEMVGELEIEQSNLSQHLGVMKKQGLVDSRKEGLKVIYRIGYPSVYQIIGAAEKTLGEQIANSQRFLQFLK